MGKLALLVKKLWRDKSFCGKGEEKWGDIRKDRFEDGRFEVEGPRIRVVLSAVQ